MKKSGFTLMELIIAIAIFLIIMSMMTPLFRSISKSNEAAQDINELDLNLGKSIDLFKKAVRSSQPISGTVWNTSGVAVYLSTITGGAISNPTGNATSSSIVINVPRERPVGSGAFVDEKVIFYTSGTSLMINSTFDPAKSNFVGVTEPTVLVERVQAVEFKYSKNIVTIYLKVQLGKKDTAKFKEIRDAAVTRINMQF